MGKFKFSKLVRDKIVEDMIAIGDKPTYRQLTDKEFAVELKKKLKEEAEELLTAPPSKVAAEVADAQEVLDFLKKTLRLSPQTIRKLRSVKVKKAGSFKRRLFVETVETQDKSPWAAFYRAHPGKYPEIR